MSKNSIKNSMAILLAASASLLLCAMPAWAGHGRGHFGKGHHNSGTRTQDVGRGQSKSSVTDGDDTSGTATDASEHPGSNKGGAVRGLDRANEVAGEHGESGRANAAGHGLH